MGHPHNVLRDRKRKIRLADREYRNLYQQIRQIENMSDEQKASLTKLVAAEARGQVLMKEELGNWRELRTMGVVRENEGKLSLTLMGRETAAQYNVQA